MRFFFKLCPPISAAVQSFKIKQAASLMVHPAMFGKKKIFFFAQISKVCTKCTFKNIKVNAPSEYYNESTQPKGSILQTCRKVFQEFGKSRENAKRADATK